MDLILKKAWEAAQKGQSYAFATIVESSLHGTPRKAGAKMVVMADGSIFGTIGGGGNEKKALEACQKALKTLKPALLTYKNLGQPGQPVCGGQMKVFIEPFAGKRELIICGAGHIALPLSVIAKILNFHVTVLDDRKEFANKKRFPHADKIIVANPAKTLRKMPITADTYIMIVTPDHKYDFECLKNIVRCDAGYIGVIASKTKREKFLKSLAAKGVSKKFLQRIDMPAGIDIGAQTPEEIAVSIAGKVISEYNQQWLNSVKFNKNL